LLIAWSWDGPYKSDNLASDSDDEKLLIKAEREAEQKMKKRR